MWKPGGDKRGSNAAIWLAVLMLSACGGASTEPEEAIRAWLENAETAAENRDRNALLSLISDNYADARGNDREAIGNMLRVYFLRQRNVSIVTKIDDISVSGYTAAQVLLTAGMAGRNDGVLGISADAWRFELELEGDDDEWLLIGARWGELGAELR